MRYATAICLKGHEGGLLIQELGASPQAIAGSSSQHILAHYIMSTGDGSAGGPSAWGSSTFANSMAQVESAVEAAEMKAPSRWRTAEAVAVVHLWSPGVRQTAVHGLQWHATRQLT